MNAREIFFQNDGIILVEGQEDVIRYLEIASQLGAEFEGEFFGWGVGGSGNFGVCAQILSELGFNRVAGIVDGDQRETANKLAKHFPKFKFSVIPADDVRTKSPIPEKPEKGGLLDLTGTLHPRFEREISQLILDINTYLNVTESRNR